MEQLSVLEYRGQRIEFEVLHADRQTLEIAVHPDGAVVAIAPLGVTFEDVYDRLCKRVRWISSQVAYFRQFEPRTPVRQFVSGETHLYLGRQYRLRVLSAEQDSVKLVGGRFVVCVQGEPSSGAVQGLLGGWYARRAAVYLEERLDACWERFSAGSAAVRPRLRLRRMRTRWGSMSASGVLTLNRDLVRAPRECIDYVIFHEFCHLEYADHGPGFRARLELVLPDWEKRKHRLELTLA